MKVPLSWLREYAPTELGADDLAERIATRGVKVESVLRPWSGLEGVVVARVVEVRDHPSSAKLCLASVDAGEGTAQVVVGVRNMAAGDLVPWAKPGSRVPGLPEALGPRTFRGEVSNGMLCSPRELGISQEHESGILLLNGEGLPPGADVKRALGLDDAVLDIEVEPNRPDFLSVFGVAREVAAATDVALVAPDLGLDEIDEAASDAATVAIEAPAACSRYVARVIRGVASRPSPLLAQARLTACGVRPISSVVDATNYAMLELGQPLHAFDMDRLAGPGIVVREARGGERLSTLDDVDRLLIGEDLLICDVEKPVAIAGVMGGATSEVSEGTSSILLESAHFVREGILRTARRLDLHTEASHRFERGSDPEALDAAATRGARLIVDWSGGSVLRGVADAGRTPARRWVSMRPSRAGALLGYPVAQRAAAAVFDRLDLPHRDEADRIEVEVPGYRVDIEREVDLIEEVARVQGYDRIGSTLPRAPSAGGLPSEYAFARRLKELLARVGLREIRPAPFVSSEVLALMGAGGAIAVANPLRAEEGFLRTQLIPGLLDAVRQNQAGGVRSVALFEVGTVFKAADPADERRQVAFAVSGIVSDGWYGDGRTFDALDAAGILDALMDEVGVDDRAFGDPPGSPFHPGRSAWVLVDGKRVGVLGELHPRVAEELDLEGRVALAEIELDALALWASKGATFRDIPRYPPVRRDLAFVVDEGTPAGAVQAELVDAAGELLTDCTLFDVWSGPPLPAGTRSLAFALDFRAPDRTLVDDEVDEVVARIVMHLEAEVSARLRA